VDRSGRDATDRYGVSAKNAWLKVGQRAAMVAASATKYSLISTAVRHGPSPRVTCNRSPIATVSSLAASGIRR
jgi:hypothetical protein